MIQKLFSIENYGEEKGSIEKGIRISKVFRNKEGHVAVFWHGFEAQNYRDIEISLIGIYRKSFNEDLQLTFSVGGGEVAKFNIKKIG